MTATLTDPTTATIAPTDPPASPPPTPDATPEPPAGSPVGTFTPTGPARLGKTDWVWEGHPVRTPWVSLFASPDPADVPALKTALDSLSAVPAKALAGMRAEFLDAASDELAGIRSAEKAIRDNATAITEAEAESKRAEAELNAFFLMKVTNFVRNKDKQEALEAAVQTATTTLARVKTELPATLAAAVDEARAAAKERLQHLLSAKNQVAKAAAEQRQEKARAALAAALAGPLAEWLIATVELVAVHAAGREIPRLSRID